MLTLDQTWIRQGLVAVPWVRFSGGSTKIKRKKFPMCRIMPFLVQLYVSNHALSMKYFNPKKVDGYAILFAGLGVGCIFRS